MGKEDTGCAIAFVIVIALVVIAAATFGILSVRETRTTCINAGYDGWLKADGADWCYRIVDGTRILTPYSVVPKRKVEGQ